VPAISGTTELVTASVGLEPSATVPVIKESLAIAPAVSIVITAAPTCFKPELHTTFPTSGVTNMPLTCSTYAHPSRAIPAPAVFMPTVQLPQLYSDGELYRLRACLIDPLKGPTP
jgi:hypothetical protein